jgi:GPH family glycoside/pentoside/hexuronide:cation symporter
MKKSIMVLAGAIILTDVVPAMAWILAAYGFVANQVQTAIGLTGIRLVMSICPAIFALLAMVFIFFYPLNKSRMAHVQSDLIERRRHSQNDG